MNINIYIYIPYCLFPIAQVLEWLRDHEPIFKKKNRGSVKLKHCAMPDKLKKAVSEKRRLLISLFPPHPTHPTPPSK